MIWVIVFGLVVVGWITWLVVEEIRDGAFEGETVFYACMGLLIGCGVVPLLALIFGAASFWLGDFGKYQESTLRCNLQAVQNTTGGNGRFFLGSGAYSSGPYYIYYCKDGDTYQADTVDARNTIIVENDDETPHVTRVRNNYRNKSHLWTFFNTPGSYDKYKTVITIPKGSVAPDYQLTGPAR